MATIIHFDISADDVQRAKKFYEQLFGWKIEKFPDSPVEYFLIETYTAAGEKGLTGGMAKREKNYQKITNFIQVESIDESIGRLKELGGQVVEEKAVIPGVGVIAGCKDTEDNTFGLLEVKKE